MWWTIVFVAFMSFLIKFSRERWWLWWFLIMWQLAQLGVRFSIIGVAVSMTISKVLKDAFESR